MDLKGLSMKGYVPLETFISCFSQLLKTAPEIVEAGAWHAIVHGLTKIWIQLSN